MNESRYSRDRNTEEDKDFFDKYSATGESEWSRGTMSPFEDDTVLSERHYNIGHRLLNKPSQFSRTLQKDFSGLGPSNYKRSDERIQDDSSDALYRCSEVDASDIEVSVKDGVVTLSGAVDSRIQKKVAEMTVERIPGVVDVDNRLVIERRGLVMDSPVP
jgi:hypothetical protein